MLEQNYNLHGMALSWVLLSVFAVAGNNIQLFKRISDINVIQYCAFYILKVKSKTEKLLEAAILLDINVIQYCA